MLKSIIVRLMRALGVVASVPVSQTTQGNSPPPEEMPTFIVRLRVRLATALNVQDAKLVFSVGNREALVLSPDMEQPLANDKWTIIRVPGFDSPEQAESFGERLEKTVQIASLKCRLGVDAGERRATTGFGKIIVDQMKEHGVDVHPNVHGLYIYPSSPNARFTNVNMTLESHVQPAPFISELTNIFSALPTTELKTYDAVRMMNDALTHREAVAQLALAIAAVEFLAQGQDWTPSQKEALQRLTDHALADAHLSASEVTEIADAIGRSMQRMGIGQGVRRLLKTLNLDYLKKEWNKLYSERSTLFHGLQYMPRSTHQNRIYSAVSLCGRIVLTAVEREVPNATDMVDTYYPRPSAT